jgi:murein DD-endopeptidase MepM/ murein hydrolase activator NlpD
MQASCGRSLIWCLLCLGFVLPPLPTRGGVKTQADGAVELYCSDADGSPHPKRLELTHILSLGDLEPLQGGRLLLGYERDGEDRGKGKIRATARLERVAGGSRRIGKLSITQNRVTGETVGAQETDLELEEGDTVSWVFKFKRFGALEAEECFVVLVGVTQPSEGCGPYPEAANSPFILPFRSGETSVISQGNCSGIGSHRFAARHAYDFALPRGTELVAIRGGVVDFVEDDSPEDTGFAVHDNVLQIRHEDGSLARYVHIGQNSALVESGETVEQGQPIAASGNAGSTGGIPHLHLQLTSCPDRRACGTLPITFSNTSAHPDGLQVGKLYRAR